MLKHFPDRVTSNPAIDPVTHSSLAQTTGKTENSAGTQVIEMMQETSEQVVTLDAKYAPHILTQCAGRTLFFPTSWVLDIIVVERSKILRLPFYAEALLGVAHYQTKVVPLVTIGHSTTAGFKPTQSSLMAVRLGEATGSLNGVAVVVDQLLGHANGNAMGDRFQLSDIPPDLWQALAHPV